MVRVLIPLPNQDFDPTESAVPWRLLKSKGHTLVFATPDGNSGAADARMLTGQGLGVLAPILKADSNGVSAYWEMEAAPEFQHPLSYEAIQISDFDALLLPGGHAPGMKAYLESTLLQSKVTQFFEAQKPVGAICHGVVLAARSRTKNGASVLFSRNTTALTKQLELTAWSLTRLWLGDYYRTYPVTVEDEVKQNLADSSQFHQGPLALRRDSLERLDLGFVVKDGNYLSARWPGDAHRFATEFAGMLK